MNIAITLVATNAYFILGLRFMKKFMNHYKGNNTITFYIFSDEDPKPYLSDNIRFKYFYRTHKCWQDGTNSKFANIISIEKDLKDEDYMYQFDADTNITKDFTDEWFLGDLVGGEHYGNRNYLKDGVGFDHNPKSKAYVPYFSKLPCTYYYGAFFGGKKDRMIDFCQTLYNNQLEDKKIPYEPVVNDESYINQYFHYNPPTLTVPCDKFEFLVSDKGGIGETRNTKLNTDEFRKRLRENTNKLFDIQHNKLIFV
jgi:hypothetical protein